MCDFKRRDAAIAVLAPEAPPATSLAKLRAVLSDIHAHDAIEARIGLKTLAGPIVRMTDQTIRTTRADGTEHMHRIYDGRLPGVYQSYAKAGCRAWVNLPRLSVARA